MKLVKLAICNYRSFGERQEIEIDDITTFIGDNSAGKTSALSALNCIFSPYSRDRFLTKSDFHISQEFEKDKLDLSIESYFLFDELEGGTRESAALKYPQVAFFFRLFDGS